MKTNLIYFSPTGTTRKTLEKIAEGIGLDTETYNLTPADTDVSINIANGVTVIGVPVYAGRVPQICIDRMKNITSAGTPAAVVALYGNREFEDALAELRDIASEAGFRVTAGAAFIGEHSYSSDEKPVAENRPDGDDLEKAYDFGKMIAQKMRSEDFTAPKIPGDTPYKERMGARGITPETDAELCIACSACAGVCPTAVISVDKTAVSDAGGCIMCCACIKTCPKNARIITAEPVLERIEMLFKNCKIRKEPVIFI